MILVTGGTGFLGSTLLSHLSKSTMPIRAIYRSTSNQEIIKQHPTVEWVEGDILDVFFLEDVMQGIEKIYHCAAKISFDPKDKEMMHKINIEGTANIVNAALKQDIEKLIHVSSIAAIGKKEDKILVDESFDWDNEIKTSQYAKSKHKAEMEVFRGIAEGLNATIVNPSIILGAWNWSEGSAQLFKRAWNNPTFYSKGASGFVDVHDVAKVMIKLMESNVHSDRFILNGQNLTFKNIFELIAKKLDKKPATIEANPLLAKIASILDNLRSKLTGTKPLLTKESLHAVNSIYKYDASKILTALPDFAFTPIEKTISTVCEKFLAEHQSS